jgi:glycosyltransferase involved in cell wall biosynthesis
MKVSLITISFNSERTLEDTIKSVIAQDYPNIEYIIIDGKSKDGTMNIVNKYRSHISKVVSEPDRGLYDAMN